MPPWLSLAAIKATAIGILLLGCFLAGVRVDSWRWEAKYHGMMEKMAQEAAIAANAAHSRELALQLKVNEARKGLDDAKQTIREKDDAIGKLNSDIGSLRNDLATYSMPRSDDTAAACQHRINVISNVAGECASLLSEGSRLLQACSRDVAERSVELKAMIDGWPK